MWSRLRRQAAKKTRPSQLRLSMEALEDRSVPAAFTAGNLVVYRVGDGSTALSNASTAVFLDEYSPSGALVQTINMPTSASGANQPLTASGIATSEGFLTVSADGHYLTLTGYAAAPGIAGIAGTVSTSTARVIGRVASDGTVDTSTTTTSFSSVGIRSATSDDGSGFWAVGAGTGVVYTPFGGSGAGTLVSSTATNLRDVQIFASQLYVSSGAGSIRLGTVGSGTPTTSGQTITSLPGFPTSSVSISSYFFADLSAGVSGLDTLYVTDDVGNQIQKYSLVSGSWTANGTIALTTARGLAATVSGNTVTIYTTNGTLLGKLTDTTGYNATIAGTLSTIATAATNTAIRGIAFVPVAAATQAPVVTASNGSTSYTENAAATVIDSGVTVTDADSGALTSATVKITGNNAPGEDVLAFTNANGISGSFTAATGTLVLSGSATVANYQLALQSVTYFNNSDNPSTANRTITFTATDGTNTSAATTKTVTVAATNDAPVVTASNGSTSYTENAAATAIDSGVTVTDLDNANLTGATVSITGNFAGAEDVLAFAAANGISGSYNANTGVLTLSGSATVANYQLALRAVTYFNSSDNPSTSNRTITFTATDGTTPSAATTKTVTVAATNDAPVVTTSGGNTAYTEDDAPTVIDAGITVTDADNANLTGATVSITGGFAVFEDVLAFTDANGITGSYDLNAGVLTLSGTATVAQYQAALRSVTYANTSNNPSAANRTISFTATDGTTPSAAATKTLTFTAVNDAPAVDASSGNTAYTENGSATVIDSGITVFDADNANLTGATVAITTNFAGSQDVLAFAAANGISGSYNAGTGVLTLTGSASVANYQLALRAVTYVNTSDSPSTADRTITFTATDGTDTSSTSFSTKVVTVAATNDAPVVTASNGSTSYTENDAATVIDSGVTVTDADSANLTGATVAITGGFAGAEDVLAFAAANGISGSYDANTGVLALTGSASVANYQLALRAVTYVNTSDSPSTADRTITFTATDGTNTSAAATKTVTVAAINDAPVNTVPGTQTATVSTTISIPGISVSDMDAGAGTVTVTVSVPAGSGTFSGTGFSNNGTNAVSITDTVANVNTALGTLQYTAPAAPGGVTVTVLTDDGGNTGSGGAQSDTDTFLITVNAGAATAAPTVTSPAAPTAVNAATFAITGTAVANSLVMVYIDVNNNGSIDAGDTVAAQQQLTGGATTFSISTPLTVNAANNFVVTATAPSASESTPTDVPTITQDSIAPALPVVSSPAAPTAVNATTFTITGTAEANSLVKVFLDANNDGVADTPGTPLAMQQLTGGGMSYFISVLLTQDTANNFVVTATDAAANASAAADVPTITEDSTAPAAPTVTGPAAPTTVNAATFTITGTAEANSLVRVFLDANNDGVADTPGTPLAQQQLSSGATTFSISVSLTQDAANNFVVTATDAVANASAAADVPTITEDSTAPAAPVVTGPAAATTVNAATFTITGTAEANSLVQVYIDVNNNGSIDAGDTVAGSQQLTGGATAFSISVPLAQDAANNFVVTATDAAANESAAADVPTVTDATPPQPPVTPPAAKPHLIAVGSDAGTPARVRVFSATGTPLADFTPFRDVYPFGYTGGVRAAVMDITGDGVDDIIVATAGSVGRVTGYDGRTGASLGTIAPFGGLPSGLVLAAGDLDGDGRDDLIIGQDSGGSKVTGYSGRTLTSFGTISAFPGFAGGVRLALGDVTGDGRADLAIGKGPGGNGLVQVYDGATLQLIGSFTSAVGYLGEVSLALGDVTGDLRAEVITSVQVAGAGTQVQAFTPQGQFVRGFAAANSFGATVGARRTAGTDGTGSATPPVTAADLNGDGYAELLLGGAPNTGGTRLLVLDGASGCVLINQFAFDQMFDFGASVAVK